MKLQAALGVMLLLASAVDAKDDWNDGRPNVCDQDTSARLAQCQAWIANAKMPDNRETSCCGVGDAYVADEVEVVGGETFARITKNYPMVPKGTLVRIPKAKMNIAALDGGNPSGHGVVFGTAYRDDKGKVVFYVYCYFGPTLT